MFQAETVKDEGIAVDSGPDRLCYRQSLHKSGGENTPETKQKEKTTMKNETKKQVLDWLALTILFAFAAIIIIPTIAVPSYFLQVAAPVLIVMALFYGVLWAMIRIYRNLKDEEKGGEKNEKSNDDNVRRDNIRDRFSVGY